MGSDQVRAQIFAIGDLDPIAFVALSGPPLVDCHRLVLARLVSCSLRVLCYRRRTLVVTGQRERAGGYPINATTTSQGSGSAKKAGCGPATRSETSAMNVPPGTLSPPVSNR